jgi:hypothetical protein
MLAEVSPSATTEAKKGDGRKRAVGKTEKPAISHSPSYPAYFYPAYFYPVYFYPAYFYPAYFYPAHFYPAHFYPAHFYPANLPVWHEPARKKSAAPPRLSI